MVPLRSQAPRRQGARAARDALDHPVTGAGRDAPLDARLVWIGDDDRGVELESVALDLPDLIVVIDVMPTGYRK